MSITFGKPHFVEEDEEPKGDGNSLPKFLVHFRRPDDYRGEFGFDWMRDNYKDICNDYENLKKEYYDAEKKNEKVKINEQEYFVPWLSMFPNQEVKLALELELIEGKINNKDIISISSVEGVNFAQNEIKLKDIKKKKDKGEEFLVTISCSGSLEKDICVNVFYKNNKLVGKLNIVKNNIRYYLPVTIVNITNNGLDSNIVSDLEIQKIFNTESFQQALIETKVNVNSLNISQEDLLSKGVISVLIDKDGTERIVANEETLDTLVEISANNNKNSNIGVNLFIFEFSRAHFRKYKPNNFDYVSFDVYEEEKVDRNGILFKQYRYICEYSPERQLENNDENLFVIIEGQVGESRVIPTRRNSCIVYKGYDKKMTTVHEIAHLLGLSEIFQSSLNEKRYNYYKQKQTLTPKEEEYVTDYENMSKYRSFFFERNHTDNFMDYYEPISNSKSPIKISFYHWQWAIMQYEVNNYIEK